MGTNKIGKAVLAISLVGAAAILTSGINKVCKKCSCTVCACK